jgi:hypothetical protein
MKDNDNGLTLLIIILMILGAFMVSSQITQREIDTHDKTLKDKNNITYKFFMDAK